MKTIYTFLFVLLATNVFATQKFVLLSGKNNIDHDGSVLKPWETISYAVSQIEAHDTICVGSGVFTEKNILIDKPVTLKGINADYSIVQAGVSNTEDNKNTVFNIQSDVAIINLTIRHGSPGILVGADATLKISYCNVINCEAETAGGGINASGNLYISNSCIANNTTNQSGGGIFASGYTRILNSTVSNNHSTGSGTFGGGILINNGIFEMKNSTVVFNSAGSKGKGIHINSSNAVVNVFYNNIVAANGIPDVGANYAQSFKNSENIDYNLISAGFSEYLDFGENSYLNSNSADEVIQAVVDSIALLPLTNSGNGVLAHPIDNHSYLALNKGGPLGTSTDVRNALRVEPDLGAYEYCPNAPMTGLEILNIDTTVFLNKATRIAVVAEPAYTSEEYILELTPASEAKAELSADTLIPTSPGMIKVWAHHISNYEIKDSIVLRAVEEPITIQSIGLNLNTNYTSVLPGTQLQFSTNVFPKTVMDTTVTWSVEPKSLATITQSGLFTAISTGEVTVSAISNSNTSIQEQINITIIEKNWIDIQINSNNVIKTGISNPCGAVLCWLTDSETERPRNRSMETALSQMNAGALRFPYGYLSNNYLWTKYPENITGRLEPCVATPNIPGNWDWAVDENGFFKNDLDFDEYVGLCRKVGAEPVVCVNIMSHVYYDDDEITIDTLIFYAKEWVRYANITKGYGIKYWQIGNEQDHHKDIYPFDEFKADYKRMAKAMHEVDPTIKTAPGLLSNWNSDMLAYCPEYIDFITCHQYLYFGGSETEGYNVWKDYGSNLIPNIKKNQDILSSSNSKMEIFVTETGITGGQYPDPQIFNLYKALLLFEMQMEQITLPNVANTFYWATHTPWNGEYGDNPIATLFSNDEKNSNHLQADILTMINSNIQSKYIGKHTQDGIVCYSTISENDSLLVVFALNKNEIPLGLSIKTDEMGEFRKFEKLTFAGQGEFDPNVSFKKQSEGQIDENVLNTTLLPQSITIIRAELDEYVATDIQSFPEFNLKIYPNPVTDILTISHNHTSELQGVIKNLSGKTIKLFECDKYCNIDVSALPVGVYFINISDGKNNHWRKFIKI